MVSGCAGAAIDALAESSNSSSSILNPAHRAPLSADEVLSQMARPPQIARFTEYDEIEASGKHRPWKVAAGLVTEFTDGVPDFVPNFERVSEDCGAVFGIGELARLGFVSGEIEADVHRSLRGMNTHAGRYFAIHSYDPHPPTEEEFFSRFGEPVAYARLSIAVIEYETVGRPQEIVSLIERNLGFCFPKYETQVTTGTSLGDLFREAKLNGTPDYRESVPALWYSYLNAFGSTDAPGPSPYTNAGVAVIAQENYLLVQVMEMNSNAQPILGVEWNDLWDAIDSYENDFWQVFN